MALLFWYALNTLYICSLIICFIYFVFCLSIFCKLIAPVRLTKKEKEKSKFEKNYKENIPTFEKVATDALKTASLCCPEPIPNAEKSQQFYIDFFLDNDNLKIPTEKRIRQITKDAYDNYFKKGYFYRPSEIIGVSFCYSDIEHGAFVRASFTATPTPKHDSH